MPEHPLTTSDVRDRALRALAEKFTEAEHVNPRFDRKRERAWWDAGKEGEDPQNPYLVPKSMDERMRESCMITFTASDGNLSIRSLYFPEVVDALIEGGVLGTLPELLRAVASLEDWGMRNEIAEKPDWTTFGNILFRLDVVSGRAALTDDCVEAMDEMEALDHRVGDD